ncbi:two component transcriptional regulator [Dinoroseobacter shibae DFL 12 = DSM 16493]|jgi:DNA-binding NarL/FixJ family response regulator|uniref:Two component transcriptional regulator n=1 Tax=Dinoroseobacter shibae (strain DSM 16493 / NCIMB 14021 / DFL 12) TaxID=398580 RepID=A8LNQ5_DINSH|nr:response regulator transcription factor [Dinoroseobacter shibae]ABV92213.1 two component transcriptional regulator [Dinoroseobacter shibae DFL 12 = DSM 16493]URF47165.1 response regulator transcription factor [Dinoroseobacter shibae]URF51476.1 response regulator transcription factor [Dinoroseobacter shibae]
MQTSHPAIEARPVSSILIVDDHPLYSDALESALEMMFTGCDIRKAQTLNAALETAQDGFDPDLVMFDLKLPDVTGVSGFKTLRNRLPDARFLVISSLASVELVQSLLNEGAAGFLPKDTSTARLRDALAKIAAGGTFVPKDFRKAETEGVEGPAAEFDHPKLAELTPQQQRIMRLICKGKPNKEIAYELSLAEATVKAHITALLRRLGARNRTEAVVVVEEAMAAQRGDEPEARAFLRR